MTVQHVQRVCGHIILEYMYEYVIFLSDNTGVQSFLVVFIWFICVYVWSSLCSFPNHIIRKIWLIIRIWLSDSWTSYLIRQYISNPDWFPRTGQYSVVYWFAPWLHWVFPGVQVRQATCQYYEGYPWVASRITSLFQIASLFERQPVSSNISSLLFGGLSVCPGALALGGPTLFHRMKYIVSLPHLFM